MIKIREENISRCMLWLLVISTIVRGFLAAFFDFGNDEVYYWTYALYPDWSHFDHPPMVGWMIQLTSLNLLLDNEFFMRLSSVLFMTADTYLIYMIGRLIKDKRAGFNAALLYTASVYAFVITGVFILPDTPLMLFMFLSVYQFLKYFLSNDRKPFNLILGGLFAGLAMLSKYSGAFIWIGVGLYVIFYERKEFAKPSLYVSGIVSLACLLPVLIWNINNDFISFAFHGERVGLFGKPRLDTFFYEILGELGYNNPINYILIIIALAALFKKNKYVQDVPRRLLLLLCLPFIGIFLWFSLTRSILPHWTAPAISFLLLFPACYLSEKHNSNDGVHVIPNGIKWSMALLAFIILIGTIEIKTGFVNLNFSERSKSTTHYGEDDITLDLYGWKQIKPQFEKIRAEKIADGLMKETDAMVELKWFPLANMDYYVAHPLKIKMLGIRDVQEIHKYKWINERRGDLQKGDDCWFLNQSSDYYDPDRYLKEYFNEIVPTDTITVTRCGKPAKYVFVYMLKDYK